MMAAFVTLLLAGSSVAQNPIREYRAGREAQIIDELIRFLAIPNLASDTPNIERNAAAIVDMFTRRGAETRLLRVEGAPPIVVGDIRVPGAKKTIAFYAHYDGQPVDPAQWS